MKKGNNWGKVSILDITMFIIVLGLIFLLGLLIWQRFNASDTVMETNVLLTLITFTMTLSVVIPYIVGRTIEAAEIRKIVQEKMDCMVSDIANEIRTSMSALMIDSGHSARMSAEMIRDKSISTEGKYIWSIGWASKALIRYYTADYDNDRMIESCVHIIKECANGLPVPKKDEASANDETSRNERDLFLRTVTDCFDAYRLRGNGNDYADFVDYMQKYITNKHFDGVEKGEEQNAKYVKEYVENHSKYLNYIKGYKDLDFEKNWRKFSMLNTTKR